MNARSERAAAFRRQLAGSSPRDVVQNLEFWQMQAGFLVTIAAGLLSVVILFPYTYAPAGGWELMSLLVHLLGAWGVFCAAKALATIAVEKAIAADVERRAAEYLRDLQAGQRARIELDQLQQTMLPNNPSMPPPAMVRLFQHICKEAKDRKFESSVNLMQPYREEPLGDIFRLQNLQKIALWLGILGTFIGLLLAVAAADLRTGDFMDIVQQMFKGLVVSFSASLAGLQVAVLLGVLVLILRRRQEEYFKRMESAVVTMLSLARNAVNKDDFFVEFSQVRQSIDALANIVHVQNREVRAQTDEIRGGMVRLGEARDGFDGFLNGLTESQRQFFAELQSLYDTLSLKNLSASLQLSLAQSARLMGDKLDAGAGRITDRIGEFNSAVEKLSVALDGQSRVSADAVKKAADQIHVNAIRMLVGRVNEMTHREVNAKNEIQELSRKIAALTNAIDRLETLPRPRTLRQFIASLVK
jgi:methyl-accepting chemotaxis protein